MKGDRVEIVVDTGDGAKTYEVNATRAGRRVEVVYAVYLQARRPPIRVAVLEELSDGGLPPRPSSSSLESAAF